MTDMISREAAIDAVNAVRDNAKAYGMPQMAMGASKCADDIRAMPSAIPAASAVKVKPLVWENSINGRWIGTPPVKLSDMGFWVFLCNEGFKRHTGNGRPLCYPTLEAAQAAAQADYEAIILAALEVTP